MHHYPLQARGPIYELAVESPLSLLTFFAAVAKKVSAAPHRATLIDHRDHKERPTPKEHNQNPPRPQENANTAQNKTKKLTERYTPHQPANATPLIIEAPSLNKNKIAAATSTDSANRRKGIAVNAGSRLTGSLHASTAIGVNVTVGLTLFTRIPNGPNSIRKAHASQHPSPPWKPNNSNDHRARQAQPDSKHSRYCPRVWLRSSRVRHVSQPAPHRAYSPPSRDRNSQPVVSTARSSNAMPAQFTRPSNASSEPNASSIAASSLTSSTSGSQPVSSARRASSFTLRAAATTFAPAAHNASTVARPIPLDAPVTRIERPEKSKVAFMMIATDA